MFEFCLLSGRHVLCLAALLNVVACTRSADLPGSRERPLVPVKAAGITVDRSPLQQTVVQAQPLEADEVPPDREIDGLVGAKAYYLHSPDLPSTYVVEVGSSGGGMPPLVLVHGLGEAGVQDFYPVLRTLSATRRVIAVELPGIGRSSLGNSPPHPDLFAERVRAVIAARLEGNFDLLGHSLGGAVALLVAARERQNLRRLVLVDVAGVLHQDAFLGSQIEWMARDAGRLSTGTARVVSLLGHKTMVVSQWLSPSDDSISWGMTRFTGLQAQSALALIQFNFGPALKAQTAPALILWGTLDTVASLRTAELLSSRLVGSQLHFFEGVGHVPMSEVPHEFSKIVEKFLLGPSPVAAPDQVVARANGGCSSQANVVFKGAFSTLVIDDCEGALLDQVTVDRLVIRESEVNISRSNIADGIEASESEIRMTGGSVLGRVALWLDTSEVDVAGTLLWGTHAAVQSQGESDFLGSAVLLEGARGEGSVHGHVVLSDGEGF